MVTTTVNVVVLFLSHGAPSFRAEIPAPSRKRRKSGDLYVRNLGPEKGRDVNHLLGLHTSRSSLSSPFETVPRSRDYLFARLSTRSHDIDIHCDLRQNNSNDFRKNYHLLAFSNVRLNIRYFLRGAMKLDFPRVNFILMWYE